MHITTYKHFVSKDPVKKVGQISKMVRLTYITQGPSKQFILIEKKVARQAYSFVTNSFKKYLRVEISHVNMERQLC